MPDASHYTADGLSQVILPRLPPAQRFKSPSSLLRRSERAKTPPFGCTYPAPSTPGTTPMSKKPRIRRKNPATRVDAVAAHLSHPTPLRRSSRLHPQGGNPGFPSPKETQVFIPITLKSSASPSKARSLDDPGETHFTVLGESRENCSASRSRVSGKSSVGSWRKPRRSPRFPISVMEERVSLTHASKSSCPCRRLQSFPQSRKSFPVDYERYEVDCNQNGGVITQKKLVCSAQVSRRIPRFSSPPGDWCNVCPTLVELDVIRRSGRLNSSSSEKDRAGSWMRKSGRLCNSHHSFSLHPYIEDPEKLLRRSSRLVNSGETSGLKGLQGIYRMRSQNNDGATHKSLIIDKFKKRRRSIVDRDKNELEGLSGNVEVDQNLLHAQAEVMEKARMDMNNFGSPAHRQESKITGNGVARMGIEKSQLLESAYSTREIESGLIVLPEPIGKTVAQGEKNMVISTVTVPREVCEGTRILQCTKNTSVTKKRACKDGAIKEWASEQDKALRKAYLIVKPSPHFWKKVSKMVPGKSAKECFERIHSNHVTPPLTLHRSKKKINDMSPLSHFNLSNCKPSDFFKENVKKIKNRRQRKLIAQKTVRHILRKHHLADQENAPDMFNVFETSQSSYAKVTPHSKVTLIPSSQLTSTFLHPVNSEGSPSVDKATATSKENDHSPEVLKVVKNMALHEKYIDQLHNREARRQVSTKTTKSIVAKECKENLVLNQEFMKAAKNALLSDAREVITQYQHKKNALSFDVQNDFDVSDKEFNSGSDFENSPAS